MKKPTKRTVKAWAILLMLGVIGCDKPITNDQIIAETKKCRAAGFNAVAMAKAMNPSVIHSIQCEPKP